MEVTERLEKEWEIDWDYKENYMVYDNIHSIHGYPARVVPEMVREIIQILKKGNNIASVLDPFVGSGTVAVESRRAGLDFWGSDLNPLAILLAKTKTMSLDELDMIRKEIKRFLKALESANAYELVKFPNSDYWFKEENIQQLSLIRQRIKSFLRNCKMNIRSNISFLLMTCFSATIRASSLSRNGEFKLYRIPQDRILGFEYDSIEHFKSEVDKILGALEIEKRRGDRRTKINIFQSNAKDLSYLGSEKVDLVLTSPPYGDSKTTVAYGQYSRLSIQWMKELMSAYLPVSIERDDYDPLLLGGEKSTKTLNTDIDHFLAISPTLRTVSDNMATLIQHEQQLLIECQTMVDQIRSNKEMTITEVMEIIGSSDLLKNLISERCRLNQLRLERDSGDVRDRKDLKRILTNHVTEFWASLESDNLNTVEASLTVLRDMLPAVKQAIRRKLDDTPSRIKEIQMFFIDLYEVVRKTDLALNNNGFQVWVVGHRTVLGKIEINMSNILRELFIELGYSEEVAPIKRKCHFKRLPHSINSTLTRDKGVKTMGEEYIIIFKKRG